MHCTRRKPAAGDVRCHVGGSVAKVLKISPDFLSKK